MSGKRTPLELALAEATVTIGGEIVALTELSHGVSLRTDTPIIPHPFPAVRMFRHSRGPWLEEERPSNEDATTHAKRLSRLAAMAGGTYQPVECRECGQREVVRCFQAKTRALVAAGLCFSCGYWHDILRSLDSANNPPRLPRCALANGRYYVVKPWSSTPAQHRGFGGWATGVRWHDGYEAKSNDLWNGSEVPAHFRDRCPDNAELIALPRITEPR